MSSPVASPASPFAARDTRRPAKLLLLLNIGQLVTLSEYRKRAGGHIAPLEAIPRTVVSWRRGASRQPGQPRISAAVSRRALGASPPGTLLTSSAWTAIGTFPLISTGSS